MRNQKHTPSVSINKDNTFIKIESPGWRKPGIISINELDNLMTTKDEASELNILLIPFTDQNTNKTALPDTSLMNTKMKISTDGNFLYIWANDVWKRIPLSFF